MTHIEDKVLYGGVNGTRQAINALRELRNMLAGKRASKVSVKWDGAPAIFAGTDPRDGKGPTEPIDWYPGTPGFFAITSSPDSGASSSAAFDVTISVGNGNEPMGKVDLETELHRLSEGGTSYGASAASEGRPAISAGAVAGEGVWRKKDPTTGLWVDLSQYESGASYQQIFIRPNAPPLGNSQWAQLPSGHD